MRLLLIAGKDYPVVRYHSLVVDEATLPESLAAVAWTTGPTRAVRPAKAAAGIAEHQPQQSRQADIVMGIVHRDLPHYGVQFHPESIATTFGSALLSNFRDLTCAHQAPSVPRPVPVLNGAILSMLMLLISWEHDNTSEWLLKLPVYEDGGEAVCLPYAGHCSNRSGSNTADSTVLDVRWHCMRGALQQASHGERIFRSLYGQSSGTDTFWLDRCALLAPSFSTLS